MGANNNDTRRQSYREPRTRIIITSKLKTQLFDLAHQTLSAENLHKYKTITQSMSSGGGCKKWADCSCGECLWALGIGRISGEGAKSGPNLNLGWFCLSCFLLFRLFVRPVMWVLHQFTSSSVNMYGYLPTPCLPDMLLLCRVVEF